MRKRDKSRKANRAYYIESNRPLGGVFFREDTGKRDRVMVSICTTFKNADKYIKNLIESVLEQTHRNVELVLVDECSTDNSEQVIKSYKDDRIKYFKLEEDTGIAQCLRSAFEVTKGEYVVFPGADDWLAPDFIERGLRDFERYPDCAGIVPKIVTMESLGNDKFQYHSVIDIPSRVYSKDWFVKKIYRSTIGVASIMALVRRKDALKFINYFIDNYVESPLSPEPLKGMYRRLFGTDMFFFLYILELYSHLVWDKSLVLYKTIQPDSIKFSELRQDSFGDILKYYHYHILTYSKVYQDFYPSSQNRMKAWIATEAIATAILYYLKNKFNPMFFRFSGSEEFLTNLSPIEKLKVALLSGPRILHRVCSYLVR